MPGAVGNIARLTREGRRARYDHVEATGASADRRFEYTATPRLPWPFARAFSAAVNAALGFTSTAVTCAAPARAAARATIPDPVPRSATRLPVKLSRPMKDAKNSLVMNHRGRKTVGRTMSRKPDARVVRRFRIR
jgi:hypothetical protein